MGLMDAAELMKEVEGHFGNESSAEAVEDNPPVARKAPAPPAPSAPLPVPALAPAIASVVELPLAPQSSSATKVTPKQQAVKQSNAKGKRWTEEEKEVLLDLAAQAEEQRMSDSERKRFIEREFAARGIKYSYDAAKQALMRLKKTPSTCKPRGAQTKPMKVSKCGFCGEPRRGHICKKKQAQQLPLAPPPPKVMATPVLPGDERLDALPVVAL